MNQVWMQIRERLPEGAVLFGRAAAALVFIFILAALYAALVRGLATMRATGRLSAHAYTVLRRLGYWAILVAGLLIVLQQFGLMENAWTTLTAVLALFAVGFIAIWSILSNTLCAIILMLTRPFDVGDTVEFPTDEIRGQVIDFNLIFTTLRDSDGSLLQVPNNMFFQRIIRRHLGNATVTLDVQADRDQPTE